MSYKLTIEWLQEAAGENGHILDVSDLGLAQQMIDRGMMLDYVANCARSWADETVRVQRCEGLEAARYEAEHHS